MVCDGCGWLFGFEVCLLSRLFNTWHLKECSISWRHLHIKIVPLKEHQLFQPLSTTHIPALAIHEYLCSILHSSQSFLHVLMFFITFHHVLLLRWKFHQAIFALFMSRDVSYMGVSKNRGAPKWMVYNGKPY